MLDTLTGTFLCTLSHTILLFVICFQQETHLTAGLPEHVSQISEESRLEFIVLLTLSMAANVLELVLLLRSLPSIGKSIFSMSFHLIAHLFLLKFVVDQHPVNHFWILFGLTTFPLLLSSAFQIGSLIKRQ